MKGLLFFRVYLSDDFRFILIPDGNPSHEFPVLDGNPSSNMNSAILGSLFETRGGGGGVGLIVRPTQKGRCLYIYNFW